MAKTSVVLFVDSGEISLSGFFILQTGGLMRLSHHVVRLWSRWADYVQYRVSRSLQFHLVSERGLDKLVGRADLSERHQQVQL